MRSMRRSWRCRVRLFPSNCIVALPEFLIRLRNRLLTDPRFISFVQSLPGGRLIATCAPAVAQAAKPYADTLAARIGARFAIEANPDWPRERLDVR